MTDIDLKQYAQEFSQTTSEQYRRAYEKYTEGLAYMDEARLEFLENGTVLEGVRPEIARSWKRCRENGVPSNAIIPARLPKQDYEDLLQREAYLLNAASSVMQSIYDYLTENHIIGAVYICDRNNVVLDITYMDQMKELFDTMGLRKGAIWGEKNVGTNAIDFALEYDSVFCTNGSDHYIEEYMVVSCVSAPLHDTDGEIAGSLTISYYRDYYNEFLTAFIKTAALLIDRQLVSARYNAMMDYVLSDTDESVLLLNSRAEVVQINRAFRKLVKDSAAKPSSLNIELLFKELDLNEAMSAASTQYEIGETFLSYKQLSIRVSLNMYRVEQYGRTEGFVITCRAIDEIISRSRQFTARALSFDFDGIVTKDPHMLKIIEESRHIAGQNCSVLLLGESGTGKEVFAQSIHGASSRAGKPFVAVNCAALPVNLVESELFGYEKGAFTDGLSTGKAGKFEIADGGTIFLDEIGELPLDVQAKLLRVLDSHSITRIGGNTEKKLDIRIIAATNRDLYQSVLQKSFREDLYYRINVVSIELPPLSEREGDVPLLIDHFLQQLNTENRGAAKKCSESFVEALCAHSWRGNVRELQNMVTRCYYLCPGNTITEAQLPHGFSEKRTVFRPSAALTVDDMEKELMIRALNDNDGNISRAAESINVSRSTFYRKMRSYGITAK